MSLPSEPLSAKCVQALQVLLEKYPAYDLRDALVRAKVEANIFLSLPPMNGHGQAHAQLVFEVLAQLTQRGWLKVAGDTTRQLLQALLELRPGLYREISGIASRYFAIGLPSIDPDGDEPTLIRLRPGMLEGDERLRLVDELQRLTVKRSNLAENVRENEELRLKINAIARELHATGGVRRGQAVAGTILEDVIASGSFGTVWKSRSANREPRATKVFHLDKLAQGLMLARFRQSIEMIRLLTSDPRSPPSIVRIHEVSGDGLAFTMDYAACGSLESLGKYEWTLATIVDRFRKICEACHYAHEQGVIHRDIKPSNILLDANLQPILIDFDISDATTSRVAYLGASTQGWLGTPVFGSPEQLVDARCANRQSDVFSLGRLLHFMLLRGVSPGMITEHEPDLDDLSTFPPTLVQIVRKSTRYDPSRRYLSVQEIIDDLDRYQTGWAAVRVALQRTTRWVQRHHAPVLGFGITMLTAVGLWRYSDMLERQRLLQRIEVLQSHCSERATRWPEHPTPRWTMVQTLRNIARGITAELEARGIIEVPRPDVEPQIPMEPDRSPRRGKKKVSPTRSFVATPQPPNPTTPQPTHDTAHASRAPNTRPAQAPADRPEAAPTPLPSAARALAEVRRDIDAQCATMTWPMLRFTLALRPRGGHFFPERQDSRDWHPAIECAKDLLSERQFDPAGEKLDVSKVVFDLVHPDAPPPQVASYQTIKALHLKGLLLYHEAKEAPDRTTAADLYAAAQAENIRAGQEAERLAEVIHEHRQTIQNWKVHYAELSRVAVRAFELADADKRHQMANLPLRPKFVACSRDLQDAERLARKAMDRLQGERDIRVFFSQKAAAYAKNQDLHAVCTPE